MNNAPDMQVVLPEELEREKALIMYLLNNTITAISKAIHRDIPKISQWIEEGNWADIKKQFYAKIHEHVEAKIGDLAQKKGELISKSLDRMIKVVESEWDEAETGTKYELAQAFETIGKALGALDVQSHGKRLELERTERISIENPEEYGELLDSIRDELK